MDLLRRFWRFPLVKVVVVFTLLAVGAGVLRGYVALGRVTVERRGIEDFGLFYASARQHLAGGSPYGPLVRPGEARAGDARNLNPPHTTLLFLPFGFLPARAALAAWLLLNLLALSDILRMVVRELGARPFSIGTLAGLVFLLAWAPAAALVITMQLGLLVAWPLTRAWRAARRGEWPRAGWWFGVSAGLKIFLLPLLPYLALRRRWGALARACMGLVLLLIAGATAFGPGAYVSWTRQFGEVTWHGHYMNASIWGVLVRMFEGFRIYEPLARAPWLVRPLWVVAAAAILGLTFWRLRVAREDPDRETVLIVTAALLASPLGWVYYFWLLLPPVAALVWRSAPSWAWWDYAAAGSVLTATLWHASATIWFQPSAAATTTVASPYFWALVVTWWWAARSEPPPGRRLASRTG